MWATLLDSFVKLVGLVAVVIAACTFRLNVHLKRAEWLSELHSKFYEGNTYKQIRRILDYRPQPDYTNLERSITTGGHDELAEALVDYLNFFEFIGTLRKLKQLNLCEIAMMFDYYIGNLTEHDFVMTFVKKQGFENLEKLTELIAEHKRKQLQ